MVKRFTMKPFRDLMLTAKDRAKLVELVDRLVLSSFEEYEEHLNNDKRVDLDRWKTVFRSGITTVYSERKKSNPHSNLPNVLMVGHLPGTLDENMFGLVHPTLESMRIKVSYTNDLSDAAVLATTVEPTAEDPFQAVAVKCIVIDTFPMAFVGLMRNLDYVVVEGTGILHLKNGERVGYVLLHSVNFPETHELPSRVRGDMSLCFLFRQEGGQTDCCGTGVIDPRGNMIRKVAQAGMAHSVMEGLKYSYVGQMKKLAWLLE